MADSARKVYFWGVKVKSYFALRYSSALFIRKSGESRGLEVTVESR